MTYRELFQEAVRLLREAGIEDAEYECRELLSHCCGMTRLSYIAQQHKDVQEHEKRALLTAAARRAEGCPLQYILGSWSFMDCELAVGEGVLIPRDDTEVCVREALRLLREQKLTRPVIADLCSGSGAIAIALAQQLPTARIWAVELSEKAFCYLEQNIRSNMRTDDRITAVRGDIRQVYSRFEDGFFDGIIANPPYICTDELPTLQKEVQSEPVMALDGGADGLDFYRVITKYWASKLKSGGTLSLEIGEEQGMAVSGMLKDNGFSHIRIIQDIQGLDRAVCGIRK